MLKEKKLVIFDWDGTLVNSLGHITESLADAAEKMGLSEKPYDERKNIIGLGMVEAVKMLYPDLGSESVESFRQYYAESFSQNPTQRSDFYDGAIPLIDALKSKGFRLAVATGKSRNGMDKALLSTGMLGCFDFTRCADESRSKPDPAMLFDVLAFFDVTASEAIMVGDTSYDMEMANRAGVEVVGVSFGVHQKSKLESYQPLSVVDSYNELRGLFFAE